MRMLMRVLAAAAGGGFPQWNCGCQHCAAAACDPARVRTGCPVAVSADCIECRSGVAAPAGVLPGAASPFGGRKRDRKICLRGLFSPVPGVDRTLGLLTLRQACGVMQTLQSWAGDLR